MKIIGVIPARYASSRFPGKPLALLRGKPLLLHVIERCQKSRVLRELIVATDDERIRLAVQNFCRVEMTSPGHPSGTDRAAEVAQRWDCDGLVNIQGDEPLIQPEIIDGVAEALARFPMSTAAAPLTRGEELHNPNVVKLVASADGRAIYFSRRAIPFVRSTAQRSPAEQLAAFPFLKHLGIYGYRRETLVQFVRWPVSSLEKAEQLEQLRALENGIPIGVITVRYDGLGVDTPEDLALVEAMLKMKRETG